MLGLPRDLRLTTGAFHVRLGFALQYRIGREIDEVFDFRLAIQKIQNFRNRETAIQAHPDLGLRKSFPQPLDQTAQDAHRSHRAWCVPRTQYRGDQILLRLLVEGQKPHHRQVAVGVIVPIKKAQLLSAMRGIVGGIQIDGDQTRATVQPLTMPFDHRVGQCFGHAKQLFATHTIFKTREGGLRSQIFPLHGITTDQ